MHYSATVSCQARWKQFNLHPNIRPTKSSSHKGIKPINSKRMVCNLAKAGQLLEVPYWLLQLLRGSQKQNIIQQMFRHWQRYDLHVRSQSPLSKIIWSVLLFYCWYEVDTYHFNVRHQHMMQYALCITKLKQYLNNLNSCFSKLIGHLRYNSTAASTVSAPVRDLSLLKSKVTVARAGRLVV